MAEVVLFTTGGTIASDDRGAGASPVLTGEQLLEGTMPQVREIAVRVVPIAQIPGGHMGLDVPTRLVEAAKRELARDEVIGAVVTHGTDTLEETAYFSYLTLSSSKPLVFTGSMRPASQLAYDGKRNLSDAVRVAAHPGARGMGPLVVFDEEIHSARWVTKTHTLKLDTFRSPFAGPLGVVHESGVYFERVPVRRPRTVLPRVAEPVDIIPMSLGCGARQLEASLRSGARGIVIAAFGGGRVYPDCLPLVSEAIANDVPIVIAPRVWGGRVEDPYGFPGAYADLRARGCIFAHHMGAFKARIQLLLALGNGMTTEEIAAWFAET